MKGDHILTVNGQNLKDSNQETAAAVLKACSGKVTMKVGRLKCKKTSNAANGKYVASEFIMHE